MRCERLGRAPVVLLVLGFALGGFSLTFTHLAGSFGGPGFEDGTGTEARFKSVSAVAVDASGNVYVADTSNHTIRKISPSGEVTTFAGLAETSGVATGRGAHARFNYPAGLAVDGSGNVYVVDTGSHSVRIVSSSGVSSTYVGYPGMFGFVNGTGALALFRNPRGITLDGSGNAYVADQGNHAIRMIAPGGVVTTLAGTGSAGNVNDTGTAASFNAPTGIVYDAISDALYVADTGNRVVRKITLPGAVVTTFAGTMGVASHVDGAPGIGKMFGPSGITVDDTGSMFYVADSVDHTIRSITSGGTLGSVAGMATYPGPQNGIGVGALFTSPADVTFYNDSLFVADTGNHTVRAIDLDTSAVVNLAGLANESGSLNDVGSLARFNAPLGLAGYPGPNDASTFSYVSDQGNQTIRRVFADGGVEFVAGSSYGFANGTGAAAQFRNPEGLALRFSDLALFVADRDNHCIRHVTYGGAVTLYAGQAAAFGSANGDRLTTASFKTPRAVALNTAGTALYVADTGNYLVRRIDLTSGQVTTLAGSGSFGTQDGNGTGASFGLMTGIHVDSSENVYVAESMTGTIRKIETDGDVTTFAGSTACCSALDGTGTDARFGYPGPTSITGGYVADPYAHLIRSINFSSAAVGTAGGVAGVSGTSDGTGTAARFNGASRLAAVGNYLFITEGHTIRLGRSEITDQATIDSSAGLVGNLRQLDTSPQTATSWEWSIIRRPSGSSATLSSTTIRNPTFTPDVADMYVFRCKATSSSGMSISTVTLNGNDPASTFTVGYPGPVTAGFNVLVNVTAQDPWGNVADGYTGTVEFSSSDGSATLPDLYTFTAGDHGMKSFIATLRRSGVQTITVTDTVSGSITGTGTFDVDPAAHSSFNVSIPATMGAGTPTDVLVEATDAYFNTITDYTGTIHFTSSDGTATLPSNYTFVSGDLGVHTFSGGVTLHTFGPQSVTATDTVTGSITGTGNTTVGPPAPASFSANRSGAQIFLAWAPSSGADHYEIHRAAPAFGGGYAFLTSTFETTYLDSAVLANSAYAYRVYAVESGGNYSPSSTPDTATTIVFTDDPLLTSTLIKAAHITEARTAVNSLRACAGLSAIIFADPTIGVGDLVKALHILELRTGLTEARLELELPSLTYTDSTLVVNETVIRRLHVSDIRNGVK